MKMLDSAVDGGIIGALSFIIVVLGYKLYHSSSCYLRRSGGEISFNMEMDSGNEE